MEEGHKINQIFLLIAGLIVTLTVGTIGYAETVVFASLMQISDSTEIINVPKAVITKISWVEFGTDDGKIEITGAKITVENNDTFSHTYQICAVLSGDGLVNSIGCTVKDLGISSGNYGIADIVFHDRIPVKHLNVVSISIEET